MGIKSSNDKAPGVIFCPYIMGQVTRRDVTMTEELGSFIRSRYAIVNYGFYPQNSYFTFYSTQVSKLRLKYSKWNNPRRGTAKCCPPLLFPVNRIRTECIYDTIKPTTIISCLLQEGVYLPEVRERWEPHRSQTWPSIYERRDFMNSLIKTISMPSLTTGVCYSDEGQEHHH